MENYDNIKRLFDKLKTIGFFERLFSWGSVKNQLVDAAGDLQLDARDVHGDARRIRFRSRDLLGLEQHPLDRPAIPDHEEEQRRYSADGKHAQNLQTAAGVVAAE